MKKIKKFASLCLALVLSAGVCATVSTFVSCGGTNSTSESTQATEYTVDVKNADGSKATGVSVQFCKVNADGSLGLCLVPVSVDENGHCVYENPYAEVEAAVYEIHVLDENGARLTLKEEVHTKAEYGNYTVQLAQ